MRRLIEDSESIPANIAGSTLSYRKASGEIEISFNQGIVTQKVKIISTPANFSGYIRWFCCPSCNKRVGKLYLPYGEEYFLCRHCHNLKYKDQFVRKRKEASLGKKHEKKANGDAIRKILEGIRKRYAKSNFSYS